MESYRKADYYEVSQVIRISPQLFLGNQEDTFKEREPAKNTRKLVETRKIIIILGPSYDHPLANLSVGCISVLLYACSVA